ncbi:Rv0361 family membrane protein [Nocardia sp. SSK8]|uniref:Rv0361 family membrane protein n=1 Tax=Nocardia sp. SSK8 TaxID=3120154 RepID=UPI0030098BC2
MPGQPYAQGQPMPGQPMPGQPYQQPGRPYQQGAPQYGAPGYGQPPRPSGGSGGKIALLLGGVVVLAAVAVGALYFVNGGGSIGGGGYDTPREAAQAWVDQKGDLEDLVCAADRDEINKYKNQATPTAAPSGNTNLPKTTTTLRSVDVKSGSSSGTFTTAMSMTILGQKTTTTATYKLVEEDGGWLVCGILNPVIETE